MVVYGQTLISYNPAVDKIPDLENYIRQVFPGLIDLNNCITPIIKWGEYFRCFTIIPMGQETKEAMWERLAPKWKKADY